jgi:O-antigen/teichoic acid export membrane protein
MNQKDKMLRNIFYSGFSFFSNVFLLILLILAGRILGDKEFGKFSFVLSVVFIFEVFIDFGLAQLLVRDIAQDEDLSVRYLGNTIGMKLVFSALLFLILVVLINIISSSKEVRVATYVLGAASVLKSLTLTSRSFFQAFERFDLDLLFLLIERIALLLFGGFVLLFNEGIIPLASVFLIVRIFTAALSLIILDQKIVKLIPKLDFNFIKELQVKALPFGLLQVSLILFAYIDTVMIFLMRTEAEAGWYSASYRIYESIVAIPSLLAVVLAPRLARLFITDKDSHLDLASRAIKYMFILAFPVITIGVIISKDIVHLLFGMGYENSIIPLQILLFGTIFVFQSWIFGAIIGSIKKEKVGMYISFTGLFFNIGLNLILIPMYGIRGASVATVFGEGMFAVLSIIYLYINDYRIPFLKLGLKPLASILIVTCLFQIYSFSNIQFLILCPSLYIILLFCFRVFDKSELEIFSRIKQIYIQKVL